MNWRADGPLVGLRFELGPTRGPQIGVVAATPDIYIAINETS